MIRLLLTHSNAACGVTVIFDSTLTHSALHVACLLSDLVVVLVVYNLYYEDLRILILVFLICYRSLLSPCLSLHLSVILSSQTLTLEV